MADTADATRPHDVRDPAAFLQLMQLEREAVRIFLNQPLFVPGLLQVPGYAKEMIGRVAGLEPDSVELAERVEVRAGRVEAFHQRLQGPNPPEIWVAIDEGVVRRTVGGPDVMREQLAYLAAVAKFDTVHLAVIPFGYGAHAGLGGSFEVHEPASGDAAVFFEGAHADYIVGADPEVARRHRAAVQHMVASGVDARPLLEQLAGAL
ncbi:DUF5753 domain-containing protein [Dactylosporangium aurantiacum]|nr:DUF5753 domain-containing protein [Dactylosporangium aurantiacum]MDG6100939.1 DUF5753 domain-containing protein [Dactylosporangium aurantiacum]